MPAAAGWAGASAAGCVGRGPVGARSAGGFCPLRSGAAAAAVVAAATAAAAAAAAAGFSWDGLGLRVAVDKGQSIHDQDAGTHRGPSLAAKPSFCVALGMDVNLEANGAVGVGKRASGALGTECLFCSA